MRSFLISVICTKIFQYMISSGSPYIIMNIIDLLFSIDIATQTLYLWEKSCVRPYLAEYKYISNSQGKIHSYILDYVCVDWISTHPLRAKRPDDRSVVWLIFGIHRFQNLSSAHSVCVTSTPLCVVNALLQIADPKCTCTDPPLANGCHGDVPTTPIHITIYCDIWNKSFICF